MTSQHLRRLNKKTFSLYEFTERSMTLRWRSSACLVQVCLFSTRGCCDWSSTASWCLWWCSYWVSIQNEESEHPIMTKQHHVLLAFIGPPPEPQLLHCSYFCFVHYSHHSGKIKNCIYSPSLHKMKEYDVILHFFYLLQSCSDQSRLAPFQKSGCCGFPRLNSSFITCSVHRLWLW